MFECAYPNVTITVSIRILAICSSLALLKAGTVKSGYLVYIPDGSTTATYALDNETCGLASSILPSMPPIMRPFDFDLEWTV